MLNTYLVEAGAGVAAADVCTVVIGNEAADLDSMVSALVLAWLRSAGGSPHTSHTLPVINCPRADFVLRTEAVFLFAAVGLDVRALVFIDEIDLERLHGQGRLRLVLVDHNVLSAGQAKCSDAVVAIIDHHSDAGLYPGADPRMIEPVGSSATLVAEAVLRERPSAMDRDSATLLLATILLDTVNLDPAAGRVTQKDRNLVARLRSLARCDPDDLFRKLAAEKFNVSGLGTDDLLRKDFKAWTTSSGAYGMSTVLTSIEEWSTKDYCLRVGLDHFARARGLICLVVMLAFTDAGGDFRRQLAVYAASAKLLRDLRAMLEAGDLDLEPIGVPDLGDSDRHVAFQQRNTSISRKKLQPRLQVFFSEGLGH